MLARIVATELPLTMQEGFGDDTKLSLIPTKSVMVMKIMSMVLENNGD